MSKRLNATNIDLLPNHVARPSYDYTKLKPGIVHIGIGAFHRGHQAAYTNDAIALSGGDWGIVGVSLRSASVSEQLNPQNGLYTLTEKSKEGEQTRLISAIKEVLVAPKESQKVIDTLASPQIKVVTLTVTEKGYHFDLGKGKLAVKNPDIEHDIAHPDSPKSMPGFIVAACKQRLLKYPDSKLTIISCDNLPANGVITKKVVSELASLSTPEVLNWIDNHVSFCSSMVDRIVPAVDEKTRKKAAKELGVDDYAMIETEPFKQWVIEDNFCTPKPDWERAGALLVDDVEIYEKLKLRTLNGSHSALAYMGVLLGYEYIHEAVLDSVLLSSVERLMKEETGPSLETPNGFNLAEYQADILSRFKNDRIAYKTQQVAMDGSQKMVQRIFAPLSDNYHNNRADSCKILLSVVGAWLQYLRAKDETGKAYEISDPMSNSLQKMLKQHGEHPEALVHALTETGIVPQDLVSNDKFIIDLTRTVESIQSKGLAQHLNDALSS